MSTCNMLELETLGSQMIVPINSPYIGVELEATNNYLKYACLQLVMHSPKCIITHEGPTMDINYFDWLEKHNALPKIAMHFTVRGVHCTNVGYLKLQRENWFGSLRLL
jgi:hypothetical protein